MKIEIYDPAMCCQTGVCGPAVDPELLRIQEALRQIQKQAPEVTVVRFGLASAPQVFVDNGKVAGLLQDEGTDCLPLVLVDGAVLTKGKYPANGKLEAVLQQAGFTVSLAADERKGSCSCGPRGCC